MASSDDERANMEADNAARDGAQQRERTPPTWYADIPNSSVREMVRRRQELAGQQEERNEVNSSDDERANMEAEHNSDRDGAQERTPPTWFGDIPNSSVREMVRRRWFGQEEAAPATTICVPEWAGSYENAAERSDPFLTVGHLEPSELSPTAKPYYPIAASAGGLLLIKRFTSQLQQLPQPVGETSVQETAPAVVVAGRRRGRPRPRPRNVDHESGSSSTSSSESHDQICSSCATWETLYVCNPATKFSERRELPRPSCADVEYAPWDYLSGVQAVMVANEDSYKVILVFSKWLLVYKSPDSSASTSAPNGWICLRFPQPAPWGRDIDGRVDENHGTHWGWVSTRTVVGGRLYFADVIPDGYRKYTLRVFEVDDELGTWKLHKSHSLRKRYWNFLSSDRYSSIGRDLDVIRSVEIVECMGAMYAVVPAMIDEHVTTEFTVVGTLEELLREPTVKDFDYLPIQFHILRLGITEGDARGDDRGHDSFCDHQVLRILVPENVDGGIAFHRETLLKSFDVLRPKRANSFWCAAEGSVIFVMTCLGYLLQIDVATGESKTGIIRGFKMVAIPHMTYSRNVDVKP